ncbi:MAG TPA: hypothetical protein PK093_12920 [Phycisphaerae bacterium]|nr:hypothetical protein [Phycisphaerae bacterium]
MTKRRQAIWQTITMQRVHVLWLLLMAMYAICAMMLIDPNSPDAISALEDELACNTFGLLLAAAIGMRRAFCHPIYSARYSAWLETPPWSHDRALPLRGVLLDWPELLAAITLAILSRNATLITFWHPPAALLGGYLLVSLYPLIATMRIGALYVYGASLIAMALAWDHPPLLVAALAAHYLLVARSIRESVRTLIWEYSVFPEIALRRSTWAPMPKRFTNATTETVRTSFRPLPATPRAPRLALIHVLALAAFVAGLYWALSSSDDATTFRDAYACCILGGLLVAFMRLIAYMAGHPAPISLLGRLTTRRLIIPGYDRVFLAPLAILIASQGCFWGLYRLGVMANIATAIASGIAIILALRLGPSLESWTMTGCYRMSLSSSLARQAQRR